MNYVYGYNSCSTVKKSLKFLDEKKLEYIFFDFVKNQIEREVLVDLIEKSNENIDKFFNKNGKLFKELNLKEKLPSLNNEEKLEYLLSDGKMIKRPIIVLDEKVFIGFNEQEVEEYLK